MKKEHFYDQLQYVVAKVPATEQLIPVGDWNGHIGAPAGVFGDAHGGHGNTEGERILEFAIANGLQSATPGSRRVTHLTANSSSGDSAQLDYILLQEFQPSNQLREPSNSSPSWDNLQPCQYQTITKKYQFDNQEDLVENWI